MKSVLSQKPKVVFIQPPVFDFALYDLFLKPYGLIRLSSWFREAGYETAYINALDWEDPATTKVLGRPKRKKNGTGKFFKQQYLLPEQQVPLPEEVREVPRRFSRYGILKEVLAEQIRKARPDIVCITSGMTYWYQGVVETAELVREHAPGAHILIGGIYASLMPEHAMRVTGADLVVKGDNPDPIKTYLADKGFPVPSGLIPLYPRAADMTGSDSGFWGQGAGVIRLNTGCPLHCDYCASDLINPEFRKGDPGEAFTVVHELYRRKGISHFGFYDDALLVNKEQVLLPFLEMVIRSGMQISFYTPNAVHIRYIDDESALLMKRAGFQEIRMGFESASDEFHALHDHKFSTDQFHNSIRMLYRAGFSQKDLPVYILAGLPGQRADEVENSIRIAAEAGVSVSIAEYSPVPGTPMWEDAVETSDFPLAEEPLYHNNLFFPTEWRGQTRDDLQRLKLLARETRL
ncbi:MAG: radical SAM protein [Spirochaetales bacterium]|nr:radical SAM protein [Spirochaetales bacterium]